MPQPTAASRASTFRILALVITALLLPTCAAAVGPCRLTCPVGQGTNGVGGSPCTPTFDAICGPCLAGTFNDGSSLVCAACHPSCATCSGGGDTECLTCSTGDAPVAGACAPGCSLTPATGCRAAALLGKAKLVIKDDPQDTKDGLKWKWAKGSEAMVADFGDPTTTDAYFLCVYDAGTRVSTSALPAGGTCAGNPCWTAKPTGFTYKNKERTPDGVVSAKLKAGDAEKALIALSAKGGLLETPDTSSFTGPLSVQLQRGDGGICFGSTFSTPFKKNVGGSFVAIGD